MYMYKCIRADDDSRKGGLGRFQWKISRDSRHTEAVRTRVRSDDEHERRRPRGGRDRVGRDTTQRSLGRILRAFVCVPGHVCLRENACFSRVTWPLRLAHKGQKRPEAIVRVSRPQRDWLLLPTRKNRGRWRVVYGTAPHGGLEPSCHGPNICLPPHHATRPTERRRRRRRRRCFRPAGLYPPFLFFFSFFFPFNTFFPPARGCSSMFQAHASQPQVRSKMVNRANTAHDAICSRCNASTK